jgi:hypothetical protein
MVSKSLGTAQTEANGEDFAASRVLGSILVLLTGQLAVGLVAISLFSLSFALSPLNPLIWAQVLAFAVIVVGGFTLVGVVFWRHRRELAVALRFDRRPAVLREAVKSPGTDKTSTKPNSAKV